MHHFFDIYTIFSTYLNTDKISTSLHDNLVVKRTTYLIVRYPLTDLLKHVREVIQQ